MEDLHYTLIIRAPYQASIRGIDGPLPMTNFPPRYRLARACHMLFRKA